MAGPAGYYVPSEASAEPGAPLSPVTPRLGLLFQSPLPRQCYAVVMGTGFQLNRTWSAACPLLGGLGPLPSPPDFLLLPLGSDDDHRCFV